MGHSGLGHIWGDVGGALSRVGTKRVRAVAQVEEFEIDDRTRIIVLRHRDEVELLEAERLVEALASIDLLVDVVVAELRDRAFGPAATGDALRHRATIDGSVWATSSTGLTTGGVFGRASRSDSDQSAAIGTVDRLGFGVEQRNLGPEEIRSGMCSLPGHPREETEESQADSDTDPPLGGGVRAPIVPATLADEESVLGLSSGRVWHRA